MAAVAPRLLAGLQGFSPCWRWLFFFFQAEDGIRDLIVTGVQTCALPISNTDGRGAADGRGDRHCCAPGIRARRRKRYPVSVRRAESFRSRGTRRKRAAQRSEERRVGKECRSRWSPYH